MKIKIPLKLTEIENAGYHLFICVLINGKKANLLIDTGASASAFDMNRIEKFIGKKSVGKMSKQKLATGLGTDSMESGKIILNEIKFKKLSFKDYEAVVIDMMHINNSYKTIHLPAIDGVIGGDLLKYFNAVIDYKEESISLSDE